MFCVKNSNRECCGCMDCRGNGDRIAFRCSQCGEGIYEGDTYWSIGELTLCESCIDEANKTARC